MVVEYGFGDIMSDTTMVELQDYALTSGKDVIDDIQKIVSTAKEEAEDCIAKNKEVLERFVEKLMADVIMNSDAIKDFFAENPIS